MREHDLREQILTVCSTVLPAVLWYAWAAHLLGSGEGSRASADNRSIWLGLIGPSALLKIQTLKFIGWFLLVRAFTPLGAGLALIGLCKAPWRAQQGRTAIAPGLKCRVVQAGTSSSGGRGSVRARIGTRLARRGFALRNGVKGGSRARVRSPRKIGDALWLTWGTSALVAMALLAEKLHHEYYWLLVAPVAAVGIGRCLAWLAKFHRGTAVAMAGSLFLLSCVQVRSTWRTPAEWSGLERAARAIAATVPANAWVVAPEALLFQADRRGCRMEWSDAAAARAAGEWEAGKRVDGPLELVEYYRRQGARYFADLGSCEADPTRKGLHDAVRRRYKVIVDRPYCLIADLSDYEVRWNGN